MGSGVDCAQARRESKPVDESTKNAARRFNLRDLDPSVAVPAPCHPKMNLLALRFAWRFLWAGVCLLSCGRTGLDADGIEEPGIDGGAIRVPENEASTDAGAVVPSEASPAPCVPSPEVCNGVDDDCNGLVDDGLTPVPCPGGGARYCVAGRMSACPARCEVCIPGSQVVCFNSYCLYWGVKTCAADGKGFGPCHEQHPPSECAGIARDQMDSPELERCCIDNGYCCMDRHDLDGDGDRNELLGACGGVTCGP